MQTIYYSNKHGTSLAVKKNNKKYTLKEFIEGHANSTTELLLIFVF